MLLRRTIILLLVIAAALYAILGWTTLNPSASGDELDALDAPLLSAQRTPGATGLGAQDASVRDAIGEALGSSSACVLVEQGNRSVAVQNSTEPYIPASSAKLLTATAALEVFGADETFATEVKGAEAEDGIVDGPLYLVGGGDPMLFTDRYQQDLTRQQDVHTSLDALADSVVAAGVREVRGGISGDDEVFDKVRSIPSWPASYLSQGQVGPIGALTVNHGFLPVNGGRVPAPDPAVHAATVFSQLLEQRGVNVIAGPGRGVAPEDTTTLASSQSKPLGEIVGHMLRESDNNVAEVLVKHLGAESTGEPTTPAGLEALVAALGDAGVVTEGLNLVDGSGLDRGGRATCASFVSALEQAGTDGPISQGLAEAGESGTLQDRMNGTPAEGQVQAKTGTLANVSSLSGWAFPEATEPLKFSLILNGTPVETAEAIQDRIAVRLASLTPVASAEFDNTVGVSVR